MITGHHREQIGVIRGERHNYYNQRYMWKTPQSLVSIGFHQIHFVRKCCKYQYVRSDLKTLSLSLCCNTSASEYR
jgi:hypothetical protein